MTKLNESIKVDRSRSCGFVYRRKSLPLHYHDKPNRLLSNFDEYREYGVKELGSDEQASFVKVAVEIYTYMGGSPETNLYSVQDVWVALGLDPTNLWDTLPHLLDGVYRPQPEPRNVDDWISKRWVMVNHYDLFKVMDSQGFREGRYKSFFEWLNLPNNYKERVSYNHFPSPKTLEFLPLGQIKQ